MSSIKKFQEKVLHIKVLFDLEEMKLIQKLNKI